MILNRLFLFKIAVILLVRMWVEISVLAISAAIFSSSSLWGCELKYRSGRAAKRGDDVILLVRMWVEISVIRLLFHRLGHPPCEDVSWNNSLIAPKTVLSVSSSLWGCELKFLNPETQQWENNVILLVRMWVEMRYIYSHQSAFPSSSLRGCELKCQIKGNFYNRCTVILLVRMCVRGNNWFNVRRNSGIFLSESRRLQFL